jgi:hypothetical protein
MNGITIAVAVFRFIMLFFTFMSLAMNLCIFTMAFGFEFFGFAMNGVAIAMALAFFVIVGMVILFAHQRSVNIAAAKFRRIYVGCTGFGDINVGLVVVKIFEVVADNGSADTGAVAMERDVKMEVRRAGRTSRSHSLIGILLELLL